MTCSQSFKIIQGFFCFELSLFLCNRLNSLGNSGLMIIMMILLLLRPHLLTPFIRSPPPMKMKIKCFVTFWIFVVKRFSGLLNMRYNFQKRNFTLIVSHYFYFVEHLFTKPSTRMVQSISGHTNLSGWQVFCF